ncbi:hypothetical protein RDV84_22795 [Lysobacter yananisis]|uniref:Uncharacterized protein n=1 Tax=Lysobacter yananisis TaxID=1003114 RepID=A0ABY9P748_9GAMM|nr:hypothetical protein [Lysobacter yananisis]WMT02759.1 hypothetical protein RDV84_22795 [Lysobacter yananisis]
MESNELLADFEAIDPRVGHLLAEAKLSQAASDQLAMDASHLVGVSEDRLEQVRGASFFLRLWYKLSGKTASLERATVADLVEVQRMAWQCLAGMQKQGLFSARAIAVVRNNISQLARTQHRLGGLVLEQTRKVGKLTQDVRVIDWRDSIKVREDYLALPELLRVVKAAFEYADKFDEHGNAVERLEQSHDLELAFTGLGISPNRRITLGEFATRLVEEVLSTGVERFSAITRIGIGERSLDPARVSGLVAGSAFNCIIDLAEEIPHAMRITRSELNGRRTEICQKAARAVVLEPDFEYDLANLAKEIVAGLALVRDLLTPDPVRQVAAAQTVAARALTIDELLAQHVPLKSHALLALDAPTPERQAYVDVLVAVAIGGEANAAQRSFLASVARVLDVDASEQRCESIRNPAVVDISRFLSTLTGRKRQVAWIIDAAFLATRDGAIDPKSRERILQMCQLFDMKNQKAEALLRNAVTLASSESPAEIAEVVCLIHAETREWATIIDFRKISLVGALDGIDKSWREDLKMCMEIRSATMKHRHEVAMSWATVGDEGFMMGVAISIGRKMANGSHEALVEKVRSYASLCSDFIYSANRPLRAFGFDPVDVPSEFGFEFAADETTDCKNEAWNDNMQRSLDNLERYFDALEAAASSSRDRLGAIEAGHWA